jgi:hypothetical protein
MLNPRAARIPDTRDRTPGSFWTRQFKVCFLKGSVLGGGVLYKMFVTASSAVLVLNESAAGRGGGRRPRC